MHRRPVYVGHVAPGQIHALQHGKGVVHGLHRRGRHGHQLLLPGGQHVGPPADNIVHHMAVVGQRLVLLHHSPQRRGVHGRQFRRQEGCRLLHPEQRRRRPIHHGLGLGGGVVQVLSHLGVHIHPLQPHGQRHIGRQARLEGPGFRQSAGKARHLVGQPAEAVQLGFPSRVRFVYVSQPPFVCGRDSFPCFGFHTVPTFPCIQGTFTAHLYAPFLISIPPSLPRYQSLPGKFSSRKPRPVPPHILG